MPTTEELLAQLETNPEMHASEENQELVIDADTRTINIPASETLFGVKGDKNIERKYFRCPRIVGDNVDLSTHLIYIAYVYTESNSGSIFPSIGIQPYHCDDVAVDGDDITFSWQLSDHVFQNAGFIAFKMYAKEKEDSPYTVFNTAPAIGTVLYTIGDGVDSIVDEYPDVINQIFSRLDEIEQTGGVTDEQIENAVNQYLEEHPITGGTTEYDKLNNLPTLEGVTISGDKTAEDYSLVKDLFSDVVGDGETDDYAALQSILDNNLFVKFPNAGQYYISQSLKIKSDHNIDLSGSTLIIDGDYSAIVHTTSQDAVARVHVYNGFIKGNCTVSDETGERIYNYPNQCGIRIASFHSTYEDLTFSDLAYGIYLDKRTTGSSGLVENRIYNVKFARCMNSAIYSHNGQSITDGILKNVKVGGDGYDHALYLNSGGGWVIDGIHCYGDSLYKVEVRNCDNTCLSNFLIAGDYSEIGLILNLYSNAMMSNMALWGNTDGSTMIQIQQSTSQTYPNKTVNADNITLTCQVDDITVNSITGYGEFYCNSLIYNDQYNCILPPTLKVRSAMNVSLRNGVAIPSTGDLNEYVEPGNYAVQTQYALDRIANLPIKQFGRLTVIEVGGADSGNYLYRKQIYEPFSMSYGDRFVRTMSTSDGGDSWNFTEWTEIKSSDQASTNLYKTVDKVENISSNSDLNTYTTPGNYGIRSNNIAGGIQNVPIAVAGRLTVARMIDESAGGYIKQTYETYTTSNGIYERYATYSSDDETWTWHDWIHISTEEYVDESIDGLKEEYRSINYAAGIFTGADFDTYTEPGNYAVKNSASISGISNMPVDQIGRLTVDNILGSLSTDSSRSIKQTYEPFISDYGLRYERTGRTNDSGANWTWTDWEEVIPMSRIIELIESMSKTLQSATGIYSGSDLNDYRTPGNYVIKSDSIANNVSNVPITNAGRLTVINILDEENDATYQNVKQVYEPYSTRHSTYERTARSTDGGTSWTWQEWKAMDGNSSSGGSYTLPIMSDTQLGGGKAIPKTSEDVPVAVDPSTGQLFVPTYPENVGGDTINVDAELKEYMNVAKPAIASAIINKGGSVEPDDSLNDYATRISAIPNDIYPAETLPMQTNLSASGLQDSVGIKLNWSNVNATGYLILRKENAMPATSADGDIVYNGTYAADGYTDTGVQKGKIYYYRIFPRNSKNQYQSLEDGAVAIVDYKDRTGQTLLGDLPLGSKIKFGQYDGADYFWEVVDTQDKPSGFVTVAADQNLGNRQYDAPEPDSPISNRRTQGNNRWAYSAVRQLLNSDQDTGAWWTAQYEYDVAPSYANQIPGFLKDFTTYEKEIVVMKTNKCILPNDDGGGTETVQDKFWFPSYYAMGLGVTQPLEDNHIYEKFVDNESRSYQSNYWLRSINGAESPSGVRIVSSSGNSSYSAASSSSYAVRPFCQLPTSAYMTWSDSDEAYVFADDSQRNPSAS